MSAPASDDKVGYKRPPSRTRWRKGQSGNPQGLKRKGAETTLAMIDRLLVTTVPIALNGHRRRVTALEAILYQLLQKAMAGESRAYRTLLKYQEFASQNSKRKLELTFVESEYTRALATRIPGSADA
jgi:Family of unknown function (DUF5681)